MAEGVDHFPASLGMDLVLLTKLRGVTFILFVTQAIISHIDLLVIDSTSLLMTLRKIVG